MMNLSKETCTINQSCLNMVRLKKYIILGCQCNVLAMVLLICFAPLNYNVFKVKSMTS